jgi:hypothetical protein
VTLHHGKDGPIRFVGPPWKMTNHVPKIEPPPLYDADQEAVMRDWLGWDQSEIDNYMAKAKS